MRLGRLYNPAENQRPDDLPLFFFHWFRAVYCQGILGMESIREHHQRVHDRIGDTYCCIQALLSQGDLIGIGIDDPKSRLDAYISLLPRIKSFSEEFKIPTVSSLAFSRAYPNTHKGDLKYTNVFSNSHSSDSVHSGALASISSFLIKIRAFSDCDSSQQIKEKFTEIDRGIQANTDFAIEAHDTVIRMKHEYSESLEYLPVEGEVKQVGDSLQDSDDTALETMAGRSHAGNFRKATWDGLGYYFTEGQAKCIKILWEQWEQNRDLINQKDVLKNTGHTSDRLRDLFKKDRELHPCWGVMIVKVKNGFYKLAD